MWVSFASMWDGPSSSSLCRLSCNFDAFLHTCVMSVVKASVMFRVGFVWAGLREKSHTK